LALISDGCADLTDGVDEVDAQHPLIDGKLDFSCEIVDMSDQRTKHHSVSRRALWANGVNDMLGEVGVKSRGRHCDGGEGCLMWGRKCNRLEM
jgi:hypothetical protein